MKSRFELTEGDLGHLVYRTTERAIEFHGKLPKEESDRLYQYREDGWIIDTDKQALIKESECPKLQEGDRVYICEEFYIIEWASYDVEKDLMEYNLTTKGI